MKALKYHRLFTEEDSQLISQAQFDTRENPQWFVRWKDDCVEFIRNLSGTCIFRVHLKRSGSCWEVDKAFINDEKYHPPKWEDQCERLDKLFLALVFKRPYKRTENQILIREDFSEALDAYEDLKTRSYEKELASAFMTYGYPKYLELNNARFLPGFMVSFACRPEEHWLKYKLEPIEITGRALPIWNIFLKRFEQDLNDLRKDFDKTFAYMVPKNHFAEAYGPDGTIRHCDHCEKSESHSNVRPILSYSNDLHIVCHDCEEILIVPRYLKTENEVCDYEMWDHLIYKAADKFHQEHKVWPQYLAANIETLEAFDNFMNEKLLKEGRIQEPQQICSFECSKFTLKILIDPNGTPRNFKLIYDEKEIIGKKKAS